MATLEYPFLIYWSFLLVSYLYSSESIQALKITKVQCNTNTSLSPDSVCTPAGHDSTANRTAAQVEKTPYETKLINEADTSTTLTLPVTFGHGRPSYTDKYAVEFGLGSPKQVLSLLFNTFTNLMWIRCTNKTLDTVRRDLYFNSKASSKYQPVPCESCNIYNLPPRKHDCLNNTCVYSGAFDDSQSSDPSSGLLSFDSLNLTDHENSDFTFVCLPYDPAPNQIKPDAGLLGLGRGDLSFISQLGIMYNNSFHYCLPSSSSYQGYLTIGKKKKNNNDLKFTPSFIRAEYPSYYFINIISISVGKIELKMDYSNVFLNRGIAVDAGTSITRLPAEAYEALRDEFRNQTGKSHLMSGPRGLLDTCYDTAGGEIITPAISFTFEGGVKVDFNGPQIFQDYDEYTRVTCLAFADNTNPPSVSILGNTLQMTMEVAYHHLDDAAGGRLGFRPNACK